MTKLNQRAIDYLTLFNISDNYSVYLSDILMRHRASYLSRCPACQHIAFEHRQGCELMKEYHAIIERYNDDWSKYLFSKELNKE